jgi:hypothetical protein
MDAETLELLLAQIASIWPRPLDDYELEAWKRLLSPPGRPALDPELVADVMVWLKHREEFRIVRPSTIAFKSHYDRAVEAAKPVPPTPAEMPVTPERGTEIIGDIRAGLEASKDDPQPSEQLL